MKLCPEQTRKKNYALFYSFALTSLSTKNNKKKSANKNISELCRVIIEEKKTCANDNTILKQSQLS